MASVLTDHPGVTFIHHLHLWLLDSDLVALSAHVVLSDQPSLHDAQQTGDQLRDVLADRFGSTRRLSTSAKIANPTDVGPPTLT